MPEDVVTMDKIVSLAKRRGFVFPSAEIYGGFANTYDYGPLGVLLKNNVRDAWIRANVQRRDDVELLDAAPELFEPPGVGAAGHVEVLGREARDGREQKRGSSRPQVAPRYR